MTLPEALRIIRAKTTLSQLRLAQLLGVGFKRYQAIERGQKMPLEGEAAAWDSKLETAEWGICLAECARRPPALEKE